MSTNTASTTGPNHTPTEYFLYHHTLCPHKKMSAQVIVVPLHLIVAGMHLCQTYPAQIILIIMSKWLWWIVFCKSYKTRSQCHYNTWYKYQNLSGSDWRTSTSIPEDSFSDKNINKYISIWKGVSLFLNWRNNFPVSIVCQIKSID